VLEAEMEKATMRKSILQIHGGRRPGLSGCLTFEWVIFAR
jgi:hypothetical protein